MLLTMSSKTLDKLYMEREPRKVVLNSNYCIISSRIRIQSAGKKLVYIKSFTNSLYPNATVSSCAADDDLYDEYYLKQLSGPEAMLALAAIVKFAYNEKYPVILLSSMTEYKKRFGYMQFIAKFIEETFGYPVIDYKKVGCTTDLIKPFKSDKVLNKINKIYKKSMNEMHKENLKRTGGRGVIKDMAEKTSKKKLAKILKQNGVYEDDLTKDEMVERYIEFCIDTPLK